MVLNIVSKPGLPENLQIKSLAAKHSEVFDLVIVPRDKADMICSYLRIEDDKDFMIIIQPGSNFPRYIVRQKLKN